MNITNLGKVLKEAGRYDQVTIILRDIATGCNGYTYPVRPFIDDDYQSKWRVEGRHIRAQSLLLLNAIVEQVEFDDKTSFTHLSAYVESHADILLHNYAIHVSHKIEPDIDMEEARNWLVLDSLIKCLHLPEEWTVSDGWKTTSGNKCEKESLWQINYLVDTGYDWYRRVCIVKAVDEETALNTFTEKISSKLKGEEMILTKHTKIKKCEDDVLVYHDIR